MLVDNHVTCHQPNWKTEYNMDSWRELLFLHLILLNIVTLTVSQPPFLHYFNISESGKYSTNSTYQKNLETLLSSLSSSTDRYGFYSSSFGDNPDRVYAIVLCRGDVELDTCRSCIKNSTIKLPQLVPNYKEAIGWYDYCMLRYSNKSIYGLPAFDPGYDMWNTENASSVKEFNQALRSLLDGLRSQAASGGARRKFAANNMGGPDFQTIYGLMQCTPDLSQKDCNNCLLSAAGEIPGLGGTTGGTILTPSCTLWYDTQQFYAQPATSAGKKDNTTRTVIIVVLTTIIPVIGFIVCICIFLRKRKQKKKQKQKAEVSGAGVSGAGDQICIGESSQYDFESISVATDNFSDSNKLGQGGFGAVYKGRLNGREIAVKRLDKESLQGEIEFKNEVMLLAKLQHKNLVRLLGFCSERTERLLIYEFVPQSSLDHFIFNPIRREQLGWDKRYKIIRGISRGLLYLHEESQLMIIHRDLKASNVLLDEDMNPKISDFGNARLFVVDKTHLSTIIIAGTRGYMAPEYAANGQFSVKSDVFSFGVLILEILSGEKNNSFYNGNNVEGLLSYAWKSWREGTYSNVIDPALRVNSGSMPEMIRCIHIGLLCVQESVAKRPAMAEVVLMLSSSSISLEVPSKPGFFLHSGSNNAKLPLLQEHRSEFTVSGHSINEASTTELFPR